MPDKKGQFEVLERAVRLNRQRVQKPKSCLFIVKQIRAAAFAVLALALSFPAFSTQFQQLKLDDSQRQSDIYSITEDSNGYLWLGTFNGLYRFDGKEFVGYQNNPNKQDSLSNNIARFIFHSSEEDLWIGTQQGLNRYIPEQDSFKRYLPSDLSNARPEVIWGFFESPTQQLLVSTDTNLYWWNGEEDRFEPILSANSDAVEIKSLVFLSSNRVLAATYERGLYVVDITTGKVKPYPHNNLLTQPGQLIHQITPLQNGVHKLNTSHGIYQLSVENWKLTKLIDGDINQQAVRISVEANSGELWLGTEQGLYTKSPNEQATKFPLGESENSPYIYTLFKDSHGNIWAGGRSFFGVHRSVAEPFQHVKLEPSTDGSFYPNVYAIEVSPKGSWLLTGDRELLYRNLETEETEVLLSFPKDLRFEINSKIRLGSTQNKLWISSIDNLLSYDLDTQELVQHSIHVDGLKLGYDYDFVTGPKGNVWLASEYHGLLKYTPNSGKTLQYIPKGRDLSNFQVKALMFDEEDKLWLGSRQGAFSFSTEDETFQHYALEISGSISTIAVNSEAIWLGTLSSGLFRFAPKTGTVQQFTANNGLSDNSVSSIVITAQDDVWLSTDSGLSHYIASTNKVVSYNSFNSVFNAEYNQHASAISPSGSLFFGGHHGITQFHPREVLPTPHKGKVHLHSLKVFNQEVHPKGPQQRLQATVDSLLPIKLLSTDSPFSIEFGYPSPAYSSSIIYRYRLRGQDAQWLTTDNDRPVATYTNLSSGDYTFEVQAQSLDGQWQSEITRVPVYIAPPFWLSNWAYCLYCLSLISILVFINRHRRQKKRAQLRIAESEERLKLSLWGSGDELWDWHITTGKIYRSNIWGLLEFPHDGRRSPTKDHESNIHPRDLSRVQQALTNHFDGESTYYEATYRVRNKSSDWLWILDRGKIVERDGDGKPLRMTGTIKDISKLKQAEHRLTLFARSVANISDAVFILNNRFRIIEVNDAFTTITGFNKNQVLNNSLRFRSYPPRFTEQVKMKLAQQGRWMGELEEMRADGTPFILELAIDPITSEEGEVTHYVGVFSDITRRKQTEEELKKLSVEDTLTGLPNRSWFQAEHAKLVAKNTRHALMVFDLDNFKKVNDSLGHQAGDELLVQVAQRLDRCTRQQDTLFRLGGDEYAVLMENTTDINTITQSVKNLQHALEKPFSISGQELITTSSIGIVLFPLDGNDSEELLRNADTAMYHAKSQGSNGYVFFSSKMNDSAKHQFHIESLLRKAIRDDHFNLYYQPKFSAATGDVDGMEALIRLHHPEFGPISPGEFIPMAEDNGLIIEIGDIVLKKACFAAQNWRRQGLMKGRMAVNVSARQFASPGFIERIGHALKVSGLPAHCLELELTEGALVEDPEGAIEVMDKVRQLGIHISLDDFGTGYSSLAYLQRFPIDTLKIDQTFVRNMTNSESGLNMVSSIIALAHNLHLTVIAEGVETEQERDILAEMHCETLQGFLMSRPLSETDFSAFLFIQQSAEEAEHEEALELPPPSQH